MRATLLVPDSIDGAGDPPFCAGPASVGVAGWLRSTLGDAAGGDDSAAVLGGGWTAGVIGGGLEDGCTGAGLVRAAVLDGLGTVVVGACSVVGEGATRVLGVCVGETGASDTVVVAGLGGVTAGGAVCTGALSTGDGTDATDGCRCGGGSAAGGADGMTGAWCGGAEGTSAADWSRGAPPRGLGGLTGVVVGSVLGSADAGTIPPLTADIETIAADASTTTKPRPRLVQAAPIVR